jgi:predicted amidohydrolase
MVPFCIAGVQMNVSLANDNLDAMEHRIISIVNRFPWVQMIVFSELAAFGPSPSHAQPMPGPAENRFCEIAHRYGLWILPGSMFELLDNKIYNTTSVINPMGQVVGRYRKMFPFRPYEVGIESGPDFFVFDVPEVGRFGVSICYDMWFPETTRTLVSMGAEVILHPTMTDTIDRDIEIPIARANAAVNQCYFFDINGCGECGIGHSIIVGPSGYVIHQAGSGEEVIPVEINLARVRRDREVGIRSLGQPLKSFRDNLVDFSVYRPHEFDHSYLNSLGPLTKPQRGAPVAGTPVVADVATTETTATALPLEKH